MGKFDGRWRIVWMEEWDSDYIDMEEPGHFSIDGSRGSFVFGTVRGDLDARLASGSDRLEFSWEGLTCIIHDANFGPADFRFFGALPASGGAPVALDRFRWLDGRY